VLVLVLVPVLVPVLALAPQRVVTMAASGTTQHLMEAARRRVVSWKQWARPSAVTAPRN